MPTLSDDDWKLLFTDAHTHNGWLDKPVDEPLLHQLYEVARLAPTSANSQPARVVFVKSPEAKERLKPAMAAGNLAKTMAAPVTAIIAYDLEFYEQFPKLSPHMDFRSMFLKMPPEKVERFAFLNGALQGGYLILAARGLGLDCGPMGGFDNALVDAAFFPDGKWKSSFLLNLGHGDPSKVRPRAPRLSFEEACRIE